MESQTDLRSEHGLNSPQTPILPLTGPLAKSFVQWPPCVRYAAWHQVFKKRCGPVLSRNKALAEDTLEGDRHVREALSRSAKSSSGGLKSGRKYKYGTQYILTWDWEVAEVKKMLMGQVASQFRVVT